MGIKDKRDVKKFSQKQAQFRAECKALEQTNTLSLRYMTEIEEYSIRCFKNSKHELMANMLDKFRIITTLTWQQFWERSRKSGLEIIPADEFKNKEFINSLNLPRGATLYVTRFGGQSSRLVFRKGTKCGRVIHILGIDLNLTLYDH